MIHRRAKVFYWLYLGMIVYLSLYPWEFRLYPRGSGLYWVPIVGRRMILDTTLNALFYIPLGAAGFLSSRRGWWGWMLGAGGGSLLSALIEWLQLWTPTRYGNLTDLSFNAAGAVLGAIGANLLGGGRAFQSGTLWDGIAPATMSRWRLGPTQALLFAAWILWQTFPFIPAIALYRLTDLPEMIVPWSWLTLIELLLGFLVLRLELGGSPWLWAAFAALPAQAFLLDHALAPSALAGAGLGWAAGKWGEARLSLRIGLLLPAWLIFEEFRPFRFAGEASAFTWAPFQTWYESTAGGYYAVIFGKLFLYLAVVWGLRKRRTAWFVAVGVPAAILSSGEWAQRYIPGRTPETTDVVLLAAAAVLLVLCEESRSELG